MSCRNLVRFLLTVTNIAPIPLTYRQQVLIELLVSRPSFLLLRFSDFQLACSRAVLDQTKAMDRSVVAKATSSDDSPTAGYLYIDIAQMTHANFEGCRQLTGYLLERIKKPNHNVKFKCLQIIKVCDMYIQCTTQARIATAGKITQRSREALLSSDCCCWVGLRERAPPSREDKAHIMRDFVRSNVSDCCEDDGVFVRWYIRYHWDSYHTTD